MNDTAFSSFSNGNGWMGSTKAICKKILASSLMVTVLSSSAHAGWASDTAKSIGASGVEYGISEMVPEGLGWEIGLAVLAGVAVFATGGLASPFVAAGTATIGGMVGGAMGLSGAAATSAGLAAIGGGSVAAGGFGVAGGAAVVTTGLGTAAAVGKSLVPDEVKEEVGKIKDSAIDSLIDLAK